MLPEQGGRANAKSVAVREAAYRANNLGVARLEQFDFPAAVQSFRRALELHSDLAIARLNLAIAHFYAGELGPARREAEAVRTNDATRLGAEYVLGLVARAENRTGDALQAFARVREADPEDVGSAVNLGQLYTQEQRFAEAVELFRLAIQLEPYQSTAAYGLATALLRSGERTEGAAAMARFQELRDSGYATAFSQVYLEQGRHAAAIASTGAEAGLVEPGVPDVTFASATATMLPGRLSSPVRAITLADVDADGDLDLAIAGDALRLFRNEGERFADATAAFDVPPIADALGIVAGDYDNDDRPDLFVLSSSRPRLLRQDSRGRFVDVTASAAAGIAGAREALTAAWLDADHDGDLDLFLPPFLMRNNGNGTFVDIAVAAGMNGTAGAFAVAPTDYDNRRDIDAFVAGPGPARLLRNMRNGSFADVAGEVGLGTAAVACVATGDVNKDGFTDAFFCRRDAAGIWALSDGRGRFVTSEADAVTAGARTAQLFDYDNDGLLDLVTAGSRGVRALRNAGNAWVDISSRAFPTAQDESAATALATGDIDSDGDTDVVTAGTGGVSIWRNGGSRNRSVRVRLDARVSNRSSLGARVELRAGSLTQQVEVASASPAPAPSDIVFGLGDREGADVVRILWPAGILQAEVAAADSGGTLITRALTVRELDRKPSSCPYLYTWNGSHFEFVTDFLGGGELGYWVAPGVRNTPDPDEYVRIEAGRLQPLNGRYELRVTNELEEALFLDRVQLLAVSHPEGTDVYPAEGLGAQSQPAPLYAVRHARPPLRAIDDDGHDVLERISVNDRTYPDHFALAPMRGYAAPHSLTLTLPPHAPGTRVVLLLTGWTDYAFSRDNVAASQAGLRLEPPSLEVKQGGKGWRKAIDNIGVPVGRPQTVPVDLTGVLAGATEVRIRTSMRIYWDRILVDVSNEPDPSEIVKIEPEAATLRWRGFSAETSPDGREPFSYDYSRVSLTSLWKLLPGRYTREGDVRELLTSVDDRFVVSRAGDDISLSFDAAALPPLRFGRTRTFLLYANGYSKEMDPHSSSPDALAPLPFRRMTEYPYTAPQRYPDTAVHHEYLEQYNTRVVPAAVPRIETWLPRRTSR
jgi:tetratricopeptide (TPR) repeat protein